MAVNIQSICTRLIRTQIMWMLYSIMSKVKSCLGTRMMGIVRIPQQAHGDGNRCPTDGNKCCGTRTWWKRNAEIKMHFAVVMQLLCTWWQKENPSATVRIPFPIRCNMTYRLRYSGIIGGTYSLNFGLMLSLAVGKEFFAGTGWDGEELCGDEWECGRICVSLQLCSPEGQRSRLQDWDVCGCEWLSDFCLSCCFCLWCFDDVNDRKVIQLVKLNLEILMVVIGDLTGSLHVLMFTVVTVVTSVFCCCCKIQDDLIWHSDTDNVVV